MNEKVTAAQVLASVLSGDGSVPLSVGWIEAQSELSAVVELVSQTGVAGQPWRIVLSMA